MANRKSEPIGDKSVRYSPLAIHHLPLYVEVFCIGMVRHQCRRRLLRFELACLESHRTAWRKFLASADTLACFLEDDVHVQPGFAALLSGAKWPPKDAHAVKLDTYFQKVRLGERLSASGGREIARLYSRHESAAAYILSRE